MAATQSATSTTWATAAAQAAQSAAGHASQVSSASTLTRAADSAGKASGSAAEAAAAAQGAYNAAKAAYDAAGAAYGASGDAQHAAGEADGSGTCDESTGQCGTCNPEVQDCGSGTVGGGAFNGPELESRTFDESIADFKSRVQSSPVGQLGASVAGAFPSGGSCPFNMTISLSLWHGSVNTNWVCGVFEDIKPILSACFLALWVLVGYRVVVSA